MSFHVSVKISLVLQFSRAELTGEGCVLVGSGSCWHCHYRGLNRKLIGCGSHSDHTQVSSENTALLGSASIGAIENNVVGDAGIVDDASSDIVAIHKNISTDRGF